MGRRHVSDIAYRMGNSALFDAAVATTQPPARCAAKAAIAALSLPTGPARTAAVAGAATGLNALALCYLPVVDPGDDMTQGLSGGRTPTRPWAVMAELRG